MNSPSTRTGVLVPLKICVGVTSCLSIIGGFLIVLTFFLRVCSCRKPRSGHSNTLWRMMLSPGRLILVNLSIADIILSTSHLWGVTDKYEKYFKNRNVTHSGCIAQGALAVYGTVASFLWTIILSFFVVGTLILPKPKLYGRPLVLIIYNLICWGMPAIILIVVAATHNLGLDRKSDTAWCYTKAGAYTFSYTVWNYLTIVLLLVFFFVTIFYSCCKQRRYTVSEAAPLVNDLTSTFQSHGRHQKSLKLIFAALILVILRLWDAIYVSLPYYHNYNEISDNNDWIVILVFLVVIGNSAQGFANAILFLLFTNTFRTWIVDSFRSCCRTTSQRPQILSNSLMIESHA